jgi:site-specific DNA-cytosine methylase
MPLVVFTARLGRSDPDALNITRKSAGPDYQIDVDGPDGHPLTNEAIVRCCGNSVPPLLAKAIVRAQFAERVVEEVA